MMMLSWRRRDPALDEINALGKKPETANSRSNPNFLWQGTCPERDLKKGG